MAPRGRVWPAPTAMSMRSRRTAPICMRPEPSRQLEACRQTTSRSGTAKRGARWAAAYPAVRCAAWRCMTRPSRRATSGRRCMSADHSASPAASRPGTSRDGRMDIGRRWVKVWAEVSARRANQSTRWRRSPVGAIDGSTQVARSPRQSHALRCGTGQRGGDWAAAPTEQSTASRSAPTASPAAEGAPQSRWSRPG